MVLWNAHLIFGPSTKQNLVQNGPIIDFWSRSRNDLDLQYSHNFIISIGFRSQAAKILKNQKFSLFFYRKALITKFDLAIK